MHYDQINRTAITDYASIAHGMPEYRVMSTSEIDRHLAIARREQSRISLDVVRRAAAWIVGLFTAGRAHSA